MHVDVCYRRHDTSMSPVEHRVTGKVPRFVMVGSAPSSGSTLVADLLDSTPGYLCGPELGIFAIGEAYGNFAAAREWERAGRPFSVPAVYSQQRSFFNRKYLEVVGLTRASYGVLLDRSDSLLEFAESISARFAEVRGRECSVFCEKTPVNVNTASNFLMAFPEGRFIHVVRDGRSVVESLIRRKYSLYEAALIWMSQVACGVALASHPRVTTMRYEDLIENPYQQILKCVGEERHGVTAKVVKDAFVRNEFRASLPRPRTWTFPRFDGVVHQHASPSTSLRRRHLDWLYSLELWNFGFQGRLGLLATFSDLQAALGYSEPIDRVNRFTVKDHLDYAQFAAKRPRVRLTSGLVVCVASDALVREPLGPAQAPGEYWRPVPGRIAMPYWTRVQADGLMAVFGGS